jgi:hypothetical protein
MMDGETARNMQSIDSNKEYCTMLHLVGYTKKTILTMHGTKNVKSIHQLLTVINTVLTVQQCSLRITPSHSLTQEYKADINGDLHERSSSILCTLAVCVCVCVYFVGGQQRDRRPYYAVYARHDNILQYKRVMMHTFSSLSTAKL